MKYLLIQCNEKVADKVKAMLNNLNKLNIGFGEAEIIDEYDDDIVAVPIKEKKDAG